MVGREGMFVAIFNDIREINGVLMGTPQAIQPKLIIHVYAE